MSQEIELQNRINKLIPVTDCIAYIHLPTNSREHEADLELNFIRLKKTKTRGINSLNLSNKAIAQIIGEMCVEVQQELAFDNSIVDVVDKDALPNHSEH